MEYKLVNIVVQVKVPIDIDESVLAHDVAKGLYEDVGFDVTAYRVESSRF